MTGVFEVLAACVTRGRIVLAIGAILDKCRLRRRKVNYYSKGKSSDICVGWIFGVQVPRHVLHGN